MASAPDDHDLAGDGEDEEAATDGRPASGSARWGLGRSRGPASGNPPNRRAPATASGRTTKWSIDRLDDRERRFSFVASGAAVALGIVVYLVENSAHFHRQKNQLSPQTVMVIGLVGGALLLGATLLGAAGPGRIRGPVHRPPLLQLHPLFGPAVPRPRHLAPLPLVQDPKGGVGTGVRGARRVEGQRSAAATRSAGGGSSRGRREARRRPKKGRTGGAARPEANKRYTPKRPPPPAPKPSRRERKAAQASD